MEIIRNDLKSEIIGNNWKRFKIGNNLKLEIIRNDFKLEIIRNDLRLEISGNNWKKLEKIGNADESVGILGSCILMLLISITRVTLDAIRAN